MIAALVSVAVFASALVLGRAWKSRSCMFLPAEPVTVLYYGALSAVYALTRRFGVSGAECVTVLAVAAAGYALGYFMGGFSHRGVVELKMDTSVSLHAYNVAYYYNAELGSYCIQEQSFVKVLRRILFGEHDTMEFPFDLVQSRVEMTLNNNYIELSHTGAMTYVVEKEERTRRSGGKIVTYTHHRFIPVDITEQGPYDFFLKTQLYLAALEMADRAKAQQLKSDIERRKAATEGGATILESINKMTPEDAAASLKQLRDFVETDVKTVAEAEGRETDAGEEVVHGEADGKA